MTAIAAFSFFALALGGRLLYPSEPDFVDGNGGTIAAFYKDGSSDILAANLVYVLAAALLLAFVGGLYEVLRRADRGLATVALGGGIAGVTLMFAAGAADMVAALRADENGAIDPQVATVMWDLNTVLFGLAAPAAFAVFVLALAAAALRTGVLPRWLGMVSVPLGVALIVPPISWAAMIAFLFWVPVAAGALLAQGRERAEAPTAAAVAR